MKRLLDDDQLESELPEDDDNRERKRNLYAQLDYLSGDDYSRPEGDVDDLLFHDPFGDKKELPQVAEKKETKVEGVENNWFAEFVNGLEDAKYGAKSGRGGYITGADEYDDLIFGKKKKKKKKKKDNEPTDFKKEFEVENQLYSNLLRDSTRFTDALQAEYNAITGKKATGRGMSKNLQDLVANITSSRQLSMSLIDKRVNLKKLATELSMKERKELGLDDNIENLGQYGSDFLKKLIEDRQMLFNGGSEDIVDIDDNMVDSLLDGDIEEYDENDPEYGHSDRTPEAEAYLKYENQNVTVYVSINSADTDDYYFYAENGDGEEINDYPLPISHIASINRSTSIATDQYGQKYKITWR